MSVTARFHQFLSNISLTELQKVNGSERREAVVRVLNFNYYGSTSGTLNSFFVGSWGKYTRIRPPRDVDVLFALPHEIYERYETRSGNKQSHLLHEVRNVIASSYPTTLIRGDGPIVLVPFTAYNVEVIPAFLLTNGRYWISMTSGGGYYKVADYKAENNQILESNKATNDNTRDLIRMMKCWQAVCSVPIKSFIIESLAVEFLKHWTHAGKSAIYYDWMVRDFLSYIVERANGTVLAAGTNEALGLGTAWKFKAETALAKAAKACSYEAASNWSAAGDEWQKIFGSDIPKYP